MEQELTHVLHTIHQLNHDVHYLKTQKLHDLLEHLDNIATDFLAKHTTQPIHHTIEQDDDDETYYLYYPIPTSATTEEWAELDLAFKRYIDI